MTRVKATAVLVSVLALAACGSDERTSTPTTAAPSSAGTPAAGGGLTVSEAIASNLDGPLLVRGYLIERDGELRLCEAILESHPPQCGEPSLRVEGDAAAVGEEQTSVLGEVRDGAITVAQTSAG
jgi:hypothetical protein